MRDYIGDNYEGYNGEFQLIWAQKEGKESARTRESGEKLVPETRKAQENTKSLNPKPPRGKCPKHRPFGPKYNYLRCFLYLKPKTWVLVPFVP